MNTYQQSKLMDSKGNYNKINIISLISMICAKTLTHYLYSKL